MSRAACALAIAALSWLAPLGSTALARVERFAVIIGSDRGAATDPELRYAESDAVRVYDVLRDLGGYEPAQMALLRGDDAQTVRSTLIAFNDRIREVSSSPGTEVVLLVYYSGHADEERLHLGETALQMSEVAQLVRGSAAQFRLVVLDACRSGAVTRRKGARVRPAFALPAGSAAGEGVAFLTASAADEDAQESDALGGSFFTHALVTGLLGAADQNRDGRVVLDEAYRFAYESTLRGTSRTYAGTQHPSFAYDYRGRGDIVLTEPGAYGGKRATLLFPPHGEVLLFDGSESGAVVADLGSHAATAQLSVRPGRYFVRVREPDVMYQGAIEVAAGSSKSIDVGDFERVEYAKLVRKGAGELRSAHGIEAGMTARSALPNERDACMGAFAGYALDLEHFGAGVRIGGCTGSWERGELSAITSSYAITGRLYRAIDIARLTLELGLQLGASVFVQRFESVGRAPSRTTFAPLAGPHLALGVDLGAGYFGALELAVQTYLLRTKAPREPEALEAPTALGGALSFGKRL